MFTGRDPLRDEPLLEGAGRRAAMGEDKIMVASGTGREAAVVGSFGGGGEPKL